MGMYNSLGFVYFLEASVAREAVRQMQGKKIGDCSIKLREPLERAWHHENTPPELKTAWAALCWQWSVDAATHEASVLRNGADANIPTTSGYVAQSEEESGVGEWVAVAQRRSPMTASRTRTDQVRGMSARADGSLGVSIPVGRYFCQVLNHPSEVFNRCRLAGKDVNAISAALQRGSTIGGTDFISFRGCPTWAISLVLPDVLRSRRGRELVLVAGVGGIDSGTGRHKHESHTAGGTAYAALGLALVEHRDAFVSCHPLFTESQGRRFYGSFVARFSS